MADLRADELFTPDELAVRLDEWALCLDKSQMDLRSDLRRAAIQLRRLAEAGTQEAEPVAWQGMDTAPKGHPTEDAGCRGPSEWFVGRPSKKYRPASPIVVVRRRAWPQDDHWEDNGETYYRHDYFDGWRPLSLFTAPPADAGMREALENVRGFLDTPVGRRRFVGDPFYDEVIASIRKALPAPGATTKPSIPVLGAESVSGAHVADRTGGANPPTGANSDGYDVRFHENVLGQLGATTKSDGGGGRARDFSTVAIDENFYFTWPKDGANEVPVQDSGGTQGKSNAALVASVDANANDDGQRVQTGNNVVTGGESATTNSSPSEPKNYFFENEEDAAEAADNGRNTGGKSYYRPSDPSSTRSEVSVEELADFLDHLDVLRIAGSANDDEAELARALLDQFEIRRK